jgi:hypothetical protein
MRVVTAPVSEDVLLTPESASKPSGVNLPRRETSLYEGHVEVTLREPAELARLFWLAATPRSQVRRISEVEELETRVAGVTRVAFKVVIRSCVGNAYSDLNRNLQRLFPPRRRGNSYAWAVQLHAGRGNRSFTRCC